MAKLLTVAAVVFCGADDGFTCGEGFFSSAGFSSSIGVKARDSSATSPPGGGGSFCSSMFSKSEAGGEAKASSLNSSAYQNVKYC